MERYFSLLQLPSVERLMLAAIVSRLTTSMLSLSLLLAVVTIHGSYAAAGGVLFCHAVALSVVAPMSGRLADRIGQRRALLVFISLRALSYANLLSALAIKAPAPMISASAAVLGATTPPRHATRLRASHLRHPPQPCRGLCSPVQSQVGGMRS